MTKLRVVSLIFLSLGIGILLGQFLGKSTTDSTPGNYKAKYEALQEKFQKLNQEEVNEYFNAGTVEEKLKKAEEILGKMILIFLADLELHVSDKKRKFAEKPKGSWIQSTIAQLQGCKPEAKQKTTTAVRTSPVPEEVPNSNTQDSKPREWSTKENKLNEISSENDISEFLQKVQIKDFLKEIQGSGLVSSSKKLRDITGEFVGTVNVTYPKAEKWKMEMSFQGKFRQEPKKKKIIGNSLIALSRDGKVFSRSRGGGEIHAFQQFTGDTKAILVQASSDIFFQIYYVEHMDSMIGNYYKQIKPGLFKYAGTLILDRK